MPLSLVSSTPVWKKLADMAASCVSLRTEFSDNPDRSEILTHNAGEWTVDFSRQLIDTSVLHTLHELAGSVQLKQRINEMFAGGRINRTENRSVLHTALRSPASIDIMVDGKLVITEIHKVLEKMKSFTSKILSGEKKGYTGKKFAHALAIGIGGSNLGPEMACKALSDYATGIDVKFVSNIDPNDLYLSLKETNPEETLIIVVSKTFTTTETMQNAMAAREWLVKKLGTDAAVKAHFVAISTNEKLITEFGISAEHTFAFWDWVGGRFSMTSSVGLPIMLSVGPENYMELLGGFHDIDTHYFETPLEQNIPVLMSLVNLWNSSFLKMQTHAVVAYDEYLTLVPDHLQQLVMESLGKRVTMEGIPIDYPTCPVFFGGTGTNVQHSYFQLLHQGAGVTVPVDFIGFVEPLHPLGKQHTDLFLNMTAQANVMAFGETAEELEKMGVSSELVPHKVIPGNKPSTLLICDRLNPRSFGQLIAIYEHMVHAWGVLLGINAFDQFGVEAGKRKAKELGGTLKGPLTMDSALKLLRPS